MVFGANVWVFQADEFSWFDFLTNYAPIPGVLLLYFGHKLVRGTRLVRPRTLVWTPSLGDLNADRQTPTPLPRPGTQRELVSLHYGTPGSAAGKAYIQASLHADELPGMLTAHHLRRQLAALELEGRIVGGHPRPHGQPHRPRSMCCTATWAASG